MKLPCEECKGRCCSFPAMSEKEFLVLKMAKPLPSGAKVVKSGGAVILVGTCPYLENGRCSVWHVRPKVCRLYGEIPEMPCQYLYPNEAEATAKQMLARRGIK